MLAADDLLASAVDAHRGEWDPERPNDWEARVKPGVACGAVVEVYTVAGETCHEGAVVEHRLSTVRCSCGGTVTREYYQRPGVKVWEYVHD